MYVIKINKIRKNLFYENINTLKEIKVYFSRKRTIILNYVYRFTIWNNREDYLSIYLKAII